jgi:regulator of PEP synthase PpsR (kinase-PPPase family)
MRSFHLHLVSDSTGETVIAVARACKYQFEDVQAIQHEWWLVRSPAQIERVVAGIKENPGIVLFTMVDVSVRIALEEACRQISTPCISVLDPVLGALASYLKVEMNAVPGRQYQLDAEYFARIDAMQFALLHNDGQMVENIEQADIVLVGVSRSSKTPTSMYLANRGYKCANYPLVPGVPLPEELACAKKPLVVGLTKDPRILADIRLSRLRFLHQNEDSAYAQYETVRNEVREARRLFTSHGWPVVDVTSRSIEEAAAVVIQLYNRHVGLAENAPPEPGRPRGES